MVIANKWQGWMKKGQLEQPLHQKTKGKGIMVSGFLTPGGKLEVPKSISNAELERNPMWVKVNDRPVRDSMWPHEYGKDNYWTGEKWYGKHYALPCQFSSMHFQSVKLFLHSTMYQATVALLKMLSLLLMFY